MTAAIVGGYVVVVVIALAVWHAIIVGGRGGHDRDD